MKILYYIILAVWYVFSLLPMRVHYVISDLLFWLLYQLVGYRRDVVRKNLKESFPEKSEEELRRIERGFYHFFCDYLVETVKLMTISQEEMKKRIVFKNAELVDEIRETELAFLNDGEIRQLKKACELHTTTWRTEDATVNACFDADRLDLGRVGIMPDPDKMATVQGRIMAEKIMEDNPEADWLLNGG